MAITTRSSCYDESVATIVRLPPEEWAQAGKAAVEKERARNQRGAEKLANQLSAAFEAAAKRHEGIAKILRKEIDLDPTSATVEFLIFRVLQFAQTFKKIVRICVRNGWSIGLYWWEKQPEKLAQLKTEAETSSYNVGYKPLHELFDEISEAAEEIIAGGKVAVESDEEEKMFGSCSLREIFTAMEFYVEKYNRKICDIYPEYATIPKMTEDQKADDSGRPVRKRARKEMN